jgi:murein DD-endopeptidase MepM/ murein hydrolase activator NlpD
MNVRLGIFGFFLGIAVLGLYGDDRIYTVQRGETLYSIARAAGIKVEELMKYNGITDPAKLQAGQRLKIPGENSGSAGTRSGDGEIATYRVVRGDTFYSIARKFSVTPAMLMETNKLPANYILREGDNLTLPKEALLPKEVLPPSEVQSPPGASGTTSTGTVAAGTATTGTVPGGTASTGTVAASEITSLRWPVTARELSYMTGKLSGVVITGVRAESVKSLTWGTVLSAGPYRGFGRVVIVQVDGGYLYVYGGCENLSVKEGDRVSPGLELGKLGVDVVTNKPQLFFMVYRSNVPIDPAKAPRA